MNLKPPSNMHSGPVKLSFEKLIEVEPGGELVPFYHFKILNKEKTVIGHINFKVGDTQHVNLCVGHIGYEILPDFRGKSLSYFACQAIKPFIRLVYDKIILTCDPKNEASKKIIEKLNAKFINEIIVPIQDPSYKSGSRKKLRFIWKP